MVTFLLINLILMSVGVMPETADSSHPITVKNCGKDIFKQRSTARIIGHKVKYHGLYPWMVAIYEDAGNGFELICGGSILNENWILTATHCIDFVNQPSKYEVYAGLHKLSQRHAPSVQKIKISKIILHEGYNGETYENDIALLKTTKPINITGSRGYVNGICLPSSNRDPTGDAIVAGWGHTYEDGENSDILRGAHVPIIPRDLCNGVYDDDPYDDIDRITETMICAGMYKRDACQNDSGGPLIQTNNDGAAVIIGVVSHGAGCGQRYFPGVYTKVSPYKQWIQEIVSNN